MNIGFCSTTVLGRGDVPQSDYIFTFLEDKEVPTIDYIRGGASEKTNKNVLHNT